MDLARLITDLLREGNDPAVVGRFAAAFVACEGVSVAAPTAEDAAADRRRQLDRERKRREKAEKLRNSAGNAENSVETAENEKGVSLPSSSLSPTPPILTTSLPSKITGGGESPKESDVSTAEALPETPEPAKPQARRPVRRECRFERLGLSGPPADWAEFAASRGVAGDALDEAFAMFANYWTSKSGRGSAKRDWLLVWQNFVMEGRARLRHWEAFQHTFAQRRTSRRGGRRGRQRASEPQALSPEARLAAVENFIEDGEWLDAWGTPPMPGELAEVRATMGRGGP